MAAHRSSWVSVFAAILTLSGCQTKSVEPVERVLRIVATDERPPTPLRLAAGMRHIRYVNPTAKVHECMLVLLPEGMTVDDFVAAVKRGEDFPKGALDYSGVGLMSPGDSTDMWLKVDPGHYILVCWNAPHVMYTLEVEKSDEPDAVPPNPDAVLTLQDYSFELSAPLHEGVQVVRVDTKGPSMHEADLFQLDEGKTADDIKAWEHMKSSVRGLPPGRALGGALDSHDISRQVWFRRTFAAGRHAWLCDMPMSQVAGDPASEITHSDAGMVMEFEVTASVKHK
jgi:hypothetical protein